jgi:ComF family protein
MLMFLNKSYFRSFFSLIYPNRCEACGALLVEGERVLCTTCRYKLPRTRYWLQKENPVEQIFWGRVPVENACSFFFMGKGSKYRKLLHKLKYNGASRIGQELGSLLGVELRQAPLYGDVDFIVPIPLHVKRLRTRGYNQSEMIAKGISQTMGKPMLADVVYRRFYNETQTKKTREERMKNVENIFAVHADKAALIENKHLLLVDDVLTTGATLEACIATILKEVNCKISVTTLAAATKM